jgi:hypothetical protein
MMTNNHLLKDMVTTKKYKKFSIQNSSILDENIITRAGDIKRGNKHGG